MAEKRLIDANALKDTLLLEGNLGYIHTLRDVERCIDANPTVQPECTCQKWHPASEIPSLHHIVDKNEVEGDYECDQSEQLLLRTENEGYKIGVYLKDGYGFNDWMEPDWGGTVRNVVE